MDDSDDIRALIRMSLEIEGGFDVVGEAATRAAAAEAAAAARPDIVILDLALDGPSSTEVVSTIARTVPTADIVVFSGSSDRTTEDALHVGASHALLKGDTADLLELMRHLRDEHGGDRRDMR